MFKYLQRILGNSSSRHEALMASRDPKVELSKTVINEVVEALKPIMEEAYTVVKSSDKQITTPHLPLGTLWPINKKKFPLLYLGTLENELNQVSIFQHDNGRKKDALNVQIVHVTKNNTSELEELKPSSQDLLHSIPYHQEKTLSLPIWEEIIHRYPVIHKLIVKLAPDHPWTLYKMAKKELCPVQGNEFLGGYPQWIVNDIDFRKIKDLQFLIQIEDFNGKEVIYYFTDGNEIIEFNQLL